MSTQQINHERTADDARGADSFACHSNPFVAESRHDESANAKAQGHGGIHKYQVAPHTDYVAK